MHQFMEVIISHSFNQSIFLTVPLHSPVGPYGARHICTDEELNVVFEEHGVGPFGARHLEGLTSRYFLTVSLYCTPFFIKQQLQLVVDLGAFHMFLQFIKQKLYFDMALHAHKRTSTYTFAHIDSRTHARTHRRIR